MGSGREPTNRMLWAYCVALACLFGLMELLAYLNSPWVMVAFVALMIVSFPAIAVAALFVRDVLPVIVFGAVVSALRLCAKLLPWPVEHFLTRREFGPLTLVLIGLAGLGVAYAIYRDIGAILIVTIGMPLMLATPFLITQLAGKLWGRLCKWYDNWGDDALR